MDKRIGSIANFRQVYPVSEEVSPQPETSSPVDSPCRAPPGVPLPGRLYRSSRPDFVDEVDVDKLESLNICSIIDFRSVKEYSKATGHKRLDSVYQVMKVIVPHSLTTVQGSPQYRAVSDKPTTGLDRKHYLVDFFRANYIWTIYKRAPWYIQLYSLLYLLFDVIFNTGFKYFVRLYARKVLNQQGLLGQYIDMVEMSQHSICAALKLLTDRSNVPAILNCAHGKDRTGIVTALVLKILGMTNQYVAREYALSQVGLENVQERLHDEIVKRYHMSKEFAMAREETMSGLLNFIEKQYGSVENYLECIGFGNSDQEQLRENITT